MIPAAGLRRRAGMLVAAMVFISGIMTILVVAFLMMIMPYYIYSATPESPHIDDLLDIAFVGEPDEDQAFEVTPEIVEELFGEEEVVDVPGTNLITALLFYGTISISIVTVVSGLLAAALATRIVRPLRQLTNVAHDVARGDLAVRASQRIRGRGRSTRTTSREVADLVEVVAEAIAAVPRHIDVSYQQGSDSLISADPALTRTVVENLLQNATKYNSPDGWVRACQGT